MWTLSWLVGGSARGALSTNMQTSDEFFLAVAKSLSMNLKDSASGMTANVQLLRGCSLETPCLSHFTAAWGVP